MWFMYNKDGAELKMEPDEFIFWATLHEHLYVSTQRYSRVLWCFEDKNLCFGSSIVDADSWDSQMSAQWRVIENGQLTLLKKISENSFPEKNLPTWLRDYNKNALLSVVQ